MSSEMREIKAMADAVEYGIALGKLDAPAVFTKMRDLLNLALLARTEAGADGAIDSRAAFERWAKPQGYRMHIRDTPGSARLGQYGDDSTQAAWEAWTASRTTRPQDARGDAEPRFKPLDRVVWTSKLGTEFRGAIRHINEPQPLSYWIDLDDGTSVQRAIGSDIAMQSKEAK